MTILRTQAGNASATFPDGTAISIKFGTADLYSFTTGADSDVAPRKIYLHVYPTACSHHTRTVSEPLRYSLRCGRRIFWRAAAAGQANED